MPDGVSRSMRPPAPTTPSCGRRINDTHSTRYSGLVQAMTCKVTWHTCQEDRAKAGIDRIAHHA